MRLCICRMLLTPHDDLRTHAEQVHGRADNLCSEGDGELRKDVGAVEVPAVAGVQHLCDLGRKREGGKDGQ